MLAPLIQEIETLNLCHNRALITTQGDLLRMFFSEEITKITKMS